MFPFSQTSSSNQSGPFWSPWLYRCISKQQIMPFIVDNVQPKRCVIESNPPIHDPPNYRNSFQSSPFSLDIQI